MRRLFLVALLIFVEFPFGWSVDIRTLGPYGGDVRSLAVHRARPDRFFLGTTDGQIYVSNNAGLNWERLFPGLDTRDVVVDNLVFHPEDPDTLYAGCWALKSSRGWLFRTRDGGNNWEQIPLGNYASQVRAVAISPANPALIAVGISEGVILSRDEGATWDRISRGYRSLHNVESLAFDPKDQNTLYVGTWRLGWKTEDLGKKWTPIHEGMNFDSDMFSLLVNPNSPHVLFASACTGIYRSGNGGLAWQKLNNGLPGEARRTRTLHFDPTEPRKIYAGTTIGVFVSENDGASWREILGEVVVNAVAVYPADPETIVVGTDDAGVLRSVDGGRSFQPSNQGFVHRQISALEVDSRDHTTVYAVIASDGLEGGVFVSRNWGRDWVAANQGLDPAVSVSRIVSSRLSNEVFLGTNEGIFRGVPSEEPWRLIASTKRLKVLDLAFSESAEGALAVATDNGIYRVDLREGDCRKWQIEVYDGRVNGVFFDLASDTLFAAADIGVLASRGGGSEWEMRVSGLPPIRVHLLGRSGERLISATSQGLYVSEDGARTWTRVRNAPTVEISSIQSNPVNPSEIYAADSTGFLLFRSDDGGSSWSEVVLGSRSRISQLAFAASGDLLAGTLSEGVYLMPAAVNSAGGR